MFGDPIGSYAGNAPVGALSELSCCPSCGSLPIEGETCCDGMGASMCSCGCGMPEGECAGAIDYMGAPCMNCGMMPEELGAQCGCVMAEAKRRKKKKGPTKKGAAKILKGADTFAQKMKKVSGWAENPPAAAAWMMHKATGKWPSEK